VAGASIFTRTNRWSTRLRPRARSCSVWSGYSRRRPGGIRSDVAFPEQATWNHAEDAVEFPVCLGDYEGKVFVGRRVFHTLIDSRPTPAQCVEYLYVNRVMFERVAEQKVRERELSDDANVRISGRDVRRA
jgi:hypothetical protein